jgi:uncharacterized protein YndB with AHSA1/START domain
MATMTRTSKLISASPEALYGAFLDPDALVAWLPPGEMTGRIHGFDGRTGGGYEMSLFYPEADSVHRGKTADREDRVTVRFVELSAPSRIVESVAFHSPDAALGGEMKLTVTFEPRVGGTEVTIECTNIPPGIRPEDNETGSRESLEQLARYIDRRVRST